MTIRHGKLLGLLRERKQLGVDGCTRPNIKAMAPWNDIRRDLLLEDSLKHMEKIIRRLLLRLQR